MVGTAKEAPVVDARRGPPSRGDRDRARVAPRAGRRAAQAHCQLGTQPRNFRQGTAQAGADAPRARPKGNRGHDQGNRHRYASQSGNSESLRRRRDLARDRRAFRHHRGGCQRRGTQRPPVLGAEAEGTPPRAHPGAQALTRSLRLSGNVVAAALTALCSGHKSGEGSAGPEPKLATVERREASVPRTRDARRLTSAWRAPLSTPNGCFARAPVRLSVLRPPLIPGERSEKQNPGAENASRERRGVAW